MFAAAAARPWGKERPVRFQCQLGKEGSQQSAGRESMQLMKMQKAACIVSAGCLHASLHKKPSTQSISLSLEIGAERRLGCL